MYPFFLEVMTMGIIELAMLSVGLAMDAFSVAVCKGLSMKKLRVGGGLVIAMYFGVFQGIMPLLGYFLGSRFADIISSFSHWVSFALLAFIGGKMVWEAFHEEAETSGEFRLDHRELFLLAIATSIDAFAVGIVFAAEKTNVLFSVSVIAAITLVISFAGVVIGNRFGRRYEKKAEVAGGVLLVLIGVKLLLDGLGVL